MTASIVEKIKPTAWFDVCRWYLACVVLANLAWEVAHLPLYTLWQTAPAGYIAFAVRHCTAGDIGIASVALLAAVLVAGTRAWPAERYGAVAVTAVLLGIGYTGYSECTNVRQSWAYSEWMPILPGTGIGLSPLLQWLVIPTIGFAWARRQTASSRRPLIEYSRRA
jgi:hypothetical protein